MMLMQAVLNMLCRQHVFEMFIINVKLKLVFQVHKIVAIFLHLSRTCIEMQSPLAFLCGLWDPSWHCLFVAMPNLQLQRPSGCIPRQICILCDSLYFPFRVITQRTVWHGGSLCLLPYMRPTQRHVLLNFAVGYRALGFDRFNTELFRVPERHRCYQLKSNCLRKMFWNSSLTVDCKW